MDGADGISCDAEVIVEEETLIPVETNDSEPALEVEIDPESLSDDYTIGYGFWYKFLFRLPSRIELEVPRENWLGIAGLTEGTDYGSTEEAGDRKLVVF